MQIVFLNRFEKGSSSEQHAQVYISENDGVWAAGWREEEQSLAVQWYEGTSWEELLASFRAGVARQMRQGYRPLLDSMLEEVPFLERRPTIAQQLQCYAELQDVPSDTMEKLKIWRRAKSQEEKRPAYLIAANRELQMLAVYAPHTTEELAQVPGFGVVKLEKYGQGLLEILREVERPDRYPLHAWIAKALAEEELSGWLLRIKEEKYNRDLAQVKLKHALLGGIRSGRGLSELAIDLDCPRRLIAEKIEWLDEEGYDVFPVVDLSLAEVPEDELIKIESAMGELGDQYLKPLRAKVYGEEISDEQVMEQQYERLRMARLRYRRTRGHAAS